MLEAIHIFVIVGLICAISSGIGGILGAVIKIKSQNILAMLFEITAGIMTGVVCFDMLPESFEISNIWYSLLGITLGVLLVYIIDYIANNINKHKSKNKYKIMAFVIMSSMAVHNIIEGLAIGATMVYSFSLGITVLVAIILHDIPEGMVVAIVNKANNKKNSKVILNSVLIGAFSGVGALLGNIIGTVKNEYISLSLSVAAGAMLYIVACDLLPSSKEISNKKYVSLIYILGIIIGALITKI